MCIEMWWCSAVRLLTIIVYWMVHCACHDVMGCIQLALTGMSSQVHQSQGKCTTNHSSVRTITHLCMLTGTHSTCITCLQTNAFVFPCTLQSSQNFRRTVGERQESWQVLVPPEVCSEETFITHGKPTVVVYCFWLCHSHAARHLSYFHTHPWPSLHL